MNEPYDMPGAKDQVLLRIQKDGRIQAAIHLDINIRFDPEYRGWVVTADDADGSHWEGRNQDYQDEAIFDLLRHRLGLNS